MQPGAPVRKQRQERTAGRGCKLGAPHILMVVGTYIVESFPSAFRVLQPPDQQTVDR